MVRREQVVALMALVRSSCAAIAQVSLNSRWRRWKKVRFFLEDGVGKNFSMHRYYKGCFGRDKYRSRKSGFRHVAPELNTAIRELVCPCSRIIKNGGIALELLSSMPLFAIKIHVSSSLLLDNMMYLLRLSVTGPNF